MKNITVLTFLLTSIICFSQTKSVKNSPTLSIDDAASVGMSDERLRRIDSMCIRAINDSIVPGIVTLVARKGKIVHYKAFGMANNTSKKELKRDDIFRIASQTKAITSTAVLMLWEEGKFRLDDPIENYIPEFKNTRVLDTMYADGSYDTKAADKPITIRHLLAHTSGIGYGVIDSDDCFKKIYNDAGITDLFTTEEISIEESVKKLAKLPLHHNPGEKFTYGEGLDILGYFIEIMSGMSLDEFFQKRIFEPLGMKDTWFYLPESESNRLVTLQTKENGSWVKYPSTFYDPDYPVKGARMFLSGGAGLSSTAFDYALFLQMLLNEGELNGTRIISRTTVHVLLANQIGDIWGEDADAYFSLAFRVINEIGENVGGLGSAGTFGWGGYFNTKYFADPNEQIIGIIMKQTQKIEGDYTNWKFRQLVFQAIDD